MNYSDLKIIHYQLWQRGILKWKLHAGQKKIYEALRALDPSVQEAVVFCARRFGKSTLGVLMALEDCLRKDLIQIRIIGPTIKQTISIVEPIIRKLTNDAPNDLIHRIKSEYRWRVGKSELVVGGFDSVNITRHLGQESHAIYLEESGAAKANDFNYAIVEVLTPQLLHSRGRKIHLTTPPLQLDHPLLTDVVPETKANNAFFHFTVFQNPLLTQAQIDDAIRESGGVDTPAFRRNYLCEVVKDDESLVVPQFDESIHIFDNNLLMEGQEVFVVGDLGGVIDQTSILLCTKHDGVIYVHDEVNCQAQTESKTIFLSLFKKQKEHQIKLKQPFFIDAPPAMMLDWLSQFKIPCVVPAKKPFLEGVTLLRQLFFRNDIKVSARCEFLIRSLKYGSLASSRKDFERSETLGHCDALAALIYAVRSVQETPWLNQMSISVEDKFAKALEKKHNKIQQEFDLIVSGQDNLKNLFKRR